MSKSKIQKIRTAILDEYRLGSNPLDASLRIQKMFGLNFETRSSTIRMWFEQFYLGDESLENDPFREDLMPKKRETRKRNCTNSITNSITSSLPNSSNDTQAKLLFQLKDQVDLLYRKINAQDCCLQLVDRFLKKLNKPNYYISTNLHDSNDQNTLKTFCINYHFLRKKCHNVLIKNNFYNILYDNLYPNSKTTKKNTVVKRRMRRRKTSSRSKSKKKSNPKKKNSKTTSSWLRKSNNSKNNSRQRLRSKSRSTKQIDDSEWPKLPIQEKAEVLEYADSLRCPIMGCSHVATNQKMFTIHQSTHANPSLPTSKDEDVPATCDRCGNVLKNRLQLKIHVRRVHEQTQRWTCPLEGCEASYARQPCLRKHIQIVHTKDARQYPCTWDNCSYVTYSSAMLQRHINVHTGERPFKCVWPGCDKAFKSNSTLAFHKSIHKNERQHKCHWPGCGYACNVSSNLNKHIAIHERKKLQMNNDVGPS